MDITGLKANETITGFDCVDQTRIDYLLRQEAVPAEPIQGQSSNGITNGHTSLIHNDLRCSLPSLPPKTENTQRARQAEPIYEELRAPANSVGAGGGMGEVELLSLISSIKDLFPDYGDGFIEAVLNEFHFQPEQTIDALCMDSISSHSKSLPRTLTRGQYAATLVGAQTTQIPDVLKGRKNIYDGDEFDVFRRDKVDLSKVHKGKKVVKDSVVSKVDDEMKARIRMLDEQKQQEEFEEEERAEIAEAEAALAASDAASRAKANEEFVEEQKAQDEADRERKERSKVESDYNAPPTRGNRGRGRGGGNRGGKPRSDGRQGQGPRKDGGRAGNRGR